MKKVELIVLIQQYQRIKASGNTSSLATRVSVLKRIDKLSQGKVADWIQDAIYGGNFDYAMDQFDQNITPAMAGGNQKTYSQWRSYFADFAKTIIGVFLSNIWAFGSNWSHGIEISLCKIVAANAIFATDSVVNEVKQGNLGHKFNLGQGNQYASWDNCRHIRNINVRKNTLLPNGLLADDNSIPNQAIKRAVIASYGLTYANFRHFKDYETCHIWDMPTDSRYYASIMNLALVPRAFGQLTDHCQAVKDLLRYEAYKRFGFVPAGEPTPAQPKYYNQIVWRII